MADHITKKWCDFFSFEFWNIAVRFDFGDLKNFRKLIITQIASFIMKIKGIAIFFWSMVRHIVFAIMNLKISRLHKNSGTSQILWNWVLPKSKDFLKFHPSYWIRYFGLKKFKILRLNSNSLTSKTSENWLSRKSHHANKANLIRPHQFPLLWSAILNPLFWISKFQGYTIRFQRFSGWG